MNGHQTGKKKLAGLLVIVLLFACSACQDGELLTNQGSPAPDATFTPKLSATPGSELPDMEDKKTPEPKTGTASFGNDTNLEPTQIPAGEESGSGAYTVTADTSESGKTYYSKYEDENALRVENAAIVSMNGATVEKLSGDAGSMENSALAGLNAALLVRDGANLKFIDSGIRTDALGANGVFVYESDLNIEGSVVRTDSDTSGGIVASGGSLTAKNLTVSTQGASSAAIRATQGGTIAMDGGTYTTGGADSPALVSTSSVTVSNAALRANNAEAIVIDGDAHATLTDCNVTGNMIGSGGVDNGENFYSVLLYQSAVGDAGGVSMFTMTNGSLSANSGDLFYVTNTSANILLEGVTLTLSNGVLLRVAGNDGAHGWGIEGVNGGDCILSATNQVLKGEILVDDGSSLELALSGESSFTGTINSDNTAGTVSVTLANNSVWTLTKDAYLTSFTGRTRNIITNGYTVYVSGDVLIK